MGTQIEVRPKAIENFVRLWKERFDDEPPKYPERRIRKWLGKAVRRGPDERVYDGWVIRLESGAVADMARLDEPAPPTVRHASGLSIDIPVWNRYIQLHMKHWPRVPMPDESRLLDLAAAAVDHGDGIRLNGPLLFRVKEGVVKQIAHVPTLSPAALTALIDGYGLTPEEATQATYLAALHGGRAGQHYMRSRGFKAPYGIRHQGRLYVMTEDVVVLDVVPAE